MNNIKISKSESHFFIIIIKHSNNNYKNRIKKEITQLRINFPKKVLQLTRIVNNNLNQLCQANKRYKYPKFKIQRPFIPIKNQNQKMILCHVKVI